MIRFDWSAGFLQVRDRDELTEWVWSGCATRPPLYVVTDPHDEEGAAEVVRSLRECQARHRR